MTTDPGPIAGLLLMAVPLACFGIAAHALLMALYDTRVRLDKNKAERESRS